MLCTLIGAIILSINIQVGLNMHLYDDIGDASSSLIWGSTSSLVTNYLKFSLLFEYISILIQFLLLIKEYNFYHIALWRLLSFLHGYHYLILFPHQSIFLQFSKKVIKISKPFYFNQTFTNSWLQFCAPNENFLFVFWLSTQKMIEKWYFQFRKNTIIHFIILIQVIQFATNCIIFFILKFKFEY